MKGSSYIQIPDNLQHHRTGLINIKNSDNECFRWCHVRLINPDANVNPNRITKKDKILAKQFNYKGIEFPVTIKQTLKSRNRTISE